MVRHGAIANHDDLRRIATVFIGNDSHCDLNLRDFCNDGGGRKIRFQ